LYWSQKLDGHLKAYEDQHELEKILFISERLKESDNTERKSSFVLLVGLIELLLTHKSNPSNTEDSIMRQFISKVSYILYLDDSKINLDELENNLRNIYTQRSNIAHGNFIELNKYMNNKKLEVTVLVSNTIKYLQIVLRKYFEDKNFVDYLKKH